jgi:ribonuclease R
MTDFEEILELLQQRANRPLGLKEIQAALDLSAGERKAVGKLLKSMVKDGTLVQLKGGRFALPGKVNLVVGTLSVHRDGYGFVSPAKGGGADVFVPARSVRPAMHGDLVVVRVERSLRGDRPEGRVIRVEQRAHKSLVGRYRVEHGVGYVTPVDPRIAEDVLIPPEGGGDAAPGQMVVVTIESYPERSRGAIGRIDEVLGAASDPRVEVRIAAIRFGLPCEFAPETMSEVDRLPLQVTAADLRGREDLRDERVFTIDGESARDFDDAVAIERRADGYRLKVAIADVSHYVRVGSAIDREALERGTSVYFPGSCLPMLPEALSNGICSLNPGVDRLVLVAEMDFDRQGRRVAMRCFDAVMRSCARLTYTQVAAALAGESAAVPDALLDDLATMRELAERRIALRTARGSLDFDLPEAEIQLDATGHPDSIVRARRTIAHRLIEEFMLAANEAVASWLQQQGKPLIFRVHEAPAVGRMEELQAFIAHFNQGLVLPAEGVSPKLLQELLGRVEGRPEETVINHVLLRSLPQAYYATVNLGHFGLAADNYCHFTSPIRRYPDLAVHRILKRAIGRGEGSDRADLDAIAQRSSLTERRAMEAERDIVKLKKCQFMADKVGEGFAGMITSVHAFGFFVELDEIFVEGLVHVSGLDDDFYQYEEERHRLIGVNRRREFTIGTRVEVRVAKVDSDRREIDFQLVDESPGSRRAGRGAAQKPGAARVQRRSRSG